MHLTAERAVALAREFHGWFGPPILVQYGAIIDGRTRYAALTAYDSQTFPRVDVSRETRTAARLLALYGHPDRAWHQIPEEWRDSAASVESYCNVDRLTALEIMAAGRELKEQLRAKEHNRKVYASRVRDISQTQRHNAVVRAIRKGLERRLEGERFDIEDVAQLVGVKL